MITLSYLVTASDSRKTPIQSCESPDGGIAVGPPGPWTDCGGSASPTAIWLRALKGPTPPSTMGTGADCWYRQQFAKPDRSTAISRLHAPAAKHVLTSSDSMTSPRMHRLTAVIMLKSATGLLAGSMLQGQCIETEGGPSPRTGAGAARGPRATAARRDQRPSLFRAGCGAAWLRERHVRDMLRVRRRRDSSPRLGKTKYLEGLVCRSLLWLARSRCRWSRRDSLGGYFICAGPRGFKQPLVLSVSSIIRRANLYSVEHGEHATVNAQPKTPKTLFLSHALDNPPSNALVISTTA